MTPPEQIADLYERHRRESSHGRARVDAPAPLCLQWDHSAGGQGEVMFDRYIPLGLDCEVIVQLRRLTGNKQAHVFDWQWVDHQAFIRILRTDFADYFQLPNLVLSEDRRHLLDTATNVEFHHLFPVAIDGTIVPQRIAREYPKVRERTEYLLRRWRETTSSQLTALYVRRDPYDDISDKKVVEMRDVLRECYPSHRFAVLLVRDAAAPGAEDLGDDIAELADGAYVAGMPVRLPRTEYWQGDDATWDRLFPKMHELRPM